MTCLVSVTQSSATIWAGHKLGCHGVATTMALIEEIERYGARGPANESSSNDRRRCDGRGGAAKLERPEH